MPVFVSHSHADSAIYTTLASLWTKSASRDGCDKDVGWRSSSRPAPHGDSGDCEVCIFLATLRSVDSPWCLAEVGAFWGSGKKVLLFMADPDLTDAMLPPQFKGNLMVSDAATLFAAAREEMARQATLAIRPERETFFETSGDYGIEKDWIQLLQETKLSFDVVGISLSSWRRTNGFTKLVKEFANAGCSSVSYCWTLKIRY